MTDERSKGFTLAELLVVIAIMSILAAIGFASYAGFKNKQAVEAEVTEIQATLREVMELSKSQADGSGWGIRFWNPTGTGNDYYEIWKGSAYSSSTVIRRMNVAANVRFNDPADGSSKDIVFQKATGLLAASSSVVVESLTGGGTGTINIDTSGRVDYTLE